MFVKQWTSKYVNAFRYVPSDEEVLLSKGEIYCFVNLIVKTSYPVDRITKMIWDGLIDEYIYSQSGPLESLKKAIKAGEKKAVSLIKNDKELEEAAVNLSYTLLVVKDSNLYLARLGEHSVNLWRNGKYINLTEILDKHGVDAGSAMIEQSDTIIVTAGEVGKMIPLQSFETGRVAKLAELMTDSEGIMLISGKEIQVPEFSLNAKDKHTPEGIEKPDLSKENLAKQEMVDDTFDPTDGEGIVDDTLEVTAENIPATSYSEMLKHQEEALEENNDSVDNTEELSIAEEEEEEFAVEPKLETETQPDEPEAVEEPRFINTNETYNDNLVGKLKKLNIKTKLKAGAEKLTKTTPFLKKFGSVVATVFVKSSEKIGALFSTVGGKLKSVLDNALGRKMWYKRFMSRVSQTRLSIGGSNVRGMKVDYYRDRDLKKKRFGMAFLVVVVVVLLVFGISYTRQIQHESDVNNKAKSYLTQANDFYESAKRNANDKKDSATLDMISANEQLKKVTDLLATEKIALSQDNQKTFDSIKVNLQLVDDSINRRVALSEKAGSIELLLDTKISFGDKSQPTDMSIYRNPSSNEFLFVSDKGEKGVFRITLADRKALKLPDSGKVLSSPQYVSAGISGVYVYDSGVGMVRGGYSENGGFDDMTKLTGLGTEAFTGRNISSLSMLQDIDTIYLLDRSTGTLLRSIRNVPDYTYGLLQKRYENTGFTLGNKILADDMNVFVIASGSAGLIRYSGGVLQDSNITQVSQEVQDLTAGYAHELGIGKMYVFDKPSKRILKLEKPIETATDQLHPGEYVMLQQYVYRGERDDVFNDVKALMVDYGEKNLYVLDGLKIWRIAL